MPVPLKQISITYHNHTSLAILNLINKQKCHRCLVTRKLKQKDTLCLKTNLALAALSNNHGMPMLFRTSNQKGLRGTILPSTSPICFFS